MVRVMVGEQACNMLIFKGKLLTLVNKMQIPDKPEWRHGGVRIQAELCEEIRDQTEQAERKKAAFPL